jgi:anti-sigma regulatory factor (Ser/Thr protein kinase)
MLLNTSDITNSLISRLKDCADLHCHKFSPEFRKIIAQTSKSAEYNLFFSLPAVADENYQSIVNFIELTLKEFYGRRNNFTTDFMIALSDAIINQISHGFKNDSTKKLDIAVEYTSDYILSCIHSKCPGWDLDSAVETAKHADSNLTLDHGRGIFIMLHYFDLFCSSQGQTYNDLILGKLTDKSKKCSLVKVYEY